MEDVYDLVVIGGGAAGFYGAIQAAEKHPHFRIIILEKTQKLLTKVKISGGGRCNVTHNCFEPVALARHYPRGEKALKNLFRNYQASDVVNWFARHGVKLKAEEDGRMFPETDDSQTIIDCFINQALKHKVKIELGAPVHAVIPKGERFIIRYNDQEINGRHVLVAIGGHSNPQAYAFIRELGHTVKPPIPSLFTFNDSEKKFKDLMGVSVPWSEVRIAGSKFVQEGPLLITHWGLSGPAVIKLSAWAAEYLHSINYDFTALVSWVGPAKEETMRETLAKHKTTHGKQRVISNPMFNLPQRLWERLCDLAEVPGNKIWSELPNRHMNKLLENLIRCPFRIRGKTTFKEEFVTCGGVELNEIDLTRMESKIVKNVLFAGEVLNIDGETGGFNFQSAWTTAYGAVKNLL